MVCFSFSFFEQHEGAFVHLCWKNLGHGLSRGLQKPHIVKIIKSFLKVKIKA